MARHGESWAVIPGKALGNPQARTRRPAYDGLVERLILQRTVRKKGTLSTPSWLSAYTLDSFVALRSVKRLPPKTDQIEEASL